MKNIETYNQFSEGIISSFKSGVSSLKDKITKSSFHKTEYQKELKTYELKLKQISEFIINIYYVGYEFNDDGVTKSRERSNLLVGKIELDHENSKSTPIWILTVYFYDSEVPKDDKKYKSIDEIDDQYEQPYAKGTMKFNVNSDNAVRAFWKWWSSKTKSGKLKNPQFRVKS